jgi:ApaG protein
MIKNTDRYISITNGIEITVKPEYIDSQVNLLAGALFVWAYHIKITNNSPETVQLTNRYWKITDEKGGIQEVKGVGVVGEQPLLNPGAVFEYTSGVHLRYPSGIMQGYYVMKKENGENFNVNIPAFSLDTPEMQETLN